MTALLNPHTEADGSVTWFFTQFRDGDDTALAELWARFFPRLQGLARTIMSRHQPRHAGADDAVQDALISFWSRVRAGQFLEEMHRDHLWQLLAQFTIFKAKRLIRHDVANKRGGRVVISESELASNHGVGLAEVASQQVDDIDFSAAEFLQILPDKLRQFAVLRLVGNSTAEISQILNCTQRKVQRKLELIKLHWIRQMTEP